MQKKRKFKLVNLQRHFWLVWLSLLIYTWWLLPSNSIPQPAIAPQTANDRVPSYNDSFRFGTNLGHRNFAWNDSQYSDLAAALGMNSLRISLPETYLETYGYDIALGNMQHYQQFNNLKSLTVFLGQPIRAHSRAPTNVSDADLSYYSPSSLYEPIWNSDGSVNANNYWANYVYRTVSTYRPYVKIWEIWNEPDATNSSNTPYSTWWNNPPNPADLPHWNDTLFSYIRLLRVSYEVIKKLDPEALVATGGLGYESFLNGILRYTDNPADGSANGSYPLNGGAYFDVLSYHYYPHYKVQDLATGQWNDSVSSDSAFDNLLTMGHNFKAQLVQYGYGTTYPSKYFIVTETGLSSQPGSDSLSGMDLLRNYMMKLQVLARVNDFKQIHTYMLTDEEADTTSTNSYNHMGMYYDIMGLTSPVQATRKVASYGLETVARQLEGTTYDASATTALNLPLGARGAVFQGIDQRVTVLWARTTDPTEVVSLNLTLDAALGLNLCDWQWSKTGSIQTLTPVNGRIQLTLTGTPVLLVSNTAPVSNPLLVVTSLADSLNPASSPVTLRQAITNAASRKGGTITFDATLGSNPQISLVAPLVVPANVRIEASCSRRVRLNATFSNVLQLSGDSSIRGLEIFTTLAPGIKAYSNGNRIECSRVIKID